ncbi:hypothetical protein L1887_45952 [Cichorium endivia]|nr:hypothetical protein L1887_45952 [Cichorium endivia]
MGLGWAAMCFFYFNMEEKELKTKKKAARGLLGEKELQGFRLIPFFRASVHSSTKTIYNLGFKSLLQFCINFKV